MVVMGRVAAPHGVHGWIRVRPFTQKPDGLADYPEWWVGGPGEWNRWSVEGTELHGRGLVAKLQGCEDRNTAEQLATLEVAVPRQALPENGVGEYYWTDLIGLQVENGRGDALGKIEALIETGANDVLVVRGERQQLIPFVEQVVVRVDLEYGRIVVDWGLDY